MSFALWSLLVGAIFLSVGLTHSFFRMKPITSAMIYLLIGIVLGPTGFYLFHFNPLKEAHLLEILTEIAVLISLFAAGVKMPVPFTLSNWTVPLRLAFLSMTLTVAAVAGFGMWLLGLPLGAAILLGAIAAPTDPVLATDVQIRHPGEEDPLRFTLTSEAGMNDGSAFPFVVLGLGLLAADSPSALLQQWLLLDVAWATSAGISIGIACGVGVAWAIKWARERLQGAKFLEDFIGLGLIALTYGISEVCQSWGFLAVFVAAISFRHTEYRLANRETPETQSLCEHTSKAPHFVSESSLVFKEHLERISELALIILIGGTLFLDSWSLRAVVFAAFLFFIARPLSVYLGLLGSSASPKLRLLSAWFGVRGIGSLYYLMYAIQHGLPESIALELIHVVLVVVTLSILLHGVSARTILYRLWPDKPVDVNR